MITLLDPVRTGPHTVVGVTGELDVATSPMLRDSLLALVNRGADSLVVDLRGVTFIDSTGVGSLLRIHHRQGLLGGSGAPLASVTGTSTPAGCANESVDLVEWREIELELERGASEELLEAVRMAARPTD